MTKLVPYPKNINSMIKYRSIYHPTINNNKSRVLCHNNYLMQQCSIYSHLLWYLVLNLNILNIQIVIIK